MKGELEGLIGSYDKVKSYEEYSLRNISVLLRGLSDLHFTAFLVWTFYVC